MSGPDDGAAGAPPAVKFWWFWLAITAAILALVYVLRGVLLPFVAGAAAAYFLDPVADWLEGRGLSRTLSTTIITALFLVVFAAGLLVLTPILHGQIAGFLSDLPAYVRAIESAATPILESVRAVLPHADVGKLADGAAGMIGGAVEWAFGLLRRILSSGAALLDLLSMLVIAPVVSFYLLRDWDRMVARIDDLLPRAHARTIRALAREADSALAGFVRGQAILCLALGTFYAVGLSVIGLKPGIVVGLGAGLISFIPYVGGIVGFLVSVGLAAAQFSNPWMIALTGGVFVIGQFIEGNFLSPWLVGGRVGLHPVWMIFALLAFGALFGFVGVLLAVPVAAILGVLARFSIERYRNSRFYDPGPADRDGP